MAKITLDKIRHSYSAELMRAGDWALKEMDVTWSDGGAYALLGPSGCGKTTLLNIISGLLIPTEGRVLFDDVDVTDLPSDQRHIAQVFQFPVVYDTMTVYDNLAFPLRNRGMPADKIRERVHEIAQMLDLQGSLKRRASGLTADGKQKISLGRGLVRPDVNVIMFDEPLTVIDPHLKWLLRSKLKELHQQVGATMIYVTHDQTEALTFADKVVVMHEGVVVQIGTPVELFERPNHTFVGHFIGSPGMNLLACDLREGKPTIDGHPLEVSAPFTPPDTGVQLQIGIRPEFVKLSREGLAVDIVKVNDVGRYRIVEARYQRQAIKLVVPEDEAIPADRAHILFDPAHTHLYADHWILT
ncbi:ABC transporter ATP-binding protein [Sedimenticola hydrogenitrophicus]|uniref:ABC transporter ATP-binding protein n=1 Tax=Sedimenticola hydrogenitrophicus TaxID=2967975 RepID=UPI0023B00560|nr:ABC transporter ATP-binding protein [Sedimenticola hydrogenitrophicus]